MEYIKQSINELLLVASILIYRKQQGIRMTPEQKIHFLNALLKKAKDVYIHYNICSSGDCIDMPPLHNMISYPHETSK